MPSPRAPHTVCVLGAGSWGIALASLLANNIAEVRLWGRNLGAAAGKRRYLPGVKLPGNVRMEADLDALVAAAYQSAAGDLVGARSDAGSTTDLAGVPAVGDSAIDSTAAPPTYAPGFVLAVPSRGFRGVVGALHRSITAAGESPNAAAVIWGSKGFDPDSGKLLGDVVREIFGGGTHAAISGPSFAAETARQLPTALTLACADSDAAESLAGWFRTPTTRVYFSTDLPGVQLGGAVKNVLAIAAGVSDGLGFGANARAALVTRGLAEMTRLGVAAGGRAATFSGLTGLGDLILTCTDDQSRNRRLGLGLGHGKTVAALQREIGEEIEGLQTTRELLRLSQQLGVEVPITEQVHHILYDHHDPHQAVRTLLQRDPKPER